MWISTITRAVAGEHLDLRFDAGHGHSVEIVEKPGRWLPAEALERLVSACREVAAACLGGDELDYGLFAPSTDAWSRSVVTLVRRTENGKPVAFNAMPLLPVQRAGQDIELLHLGLVMVEPGERSGGLSWILYGLTCFALFLRGGMRPLWVSSVTQVPAVVGMVAETFDDVYPAQAGTRASFAHRHLAHQIMATQRSAFGVGEEAGFEPETQVITNAYTGGSDNLKKTFEVAAKHRDERYNAFCRTVLDYERGDDVLQIGRLDFATARRFLVRSVPRRALPQIAVQAAVLAMQALMAPLLQWLDAKRPLGRLRPAR